METMTTGNPRFIFASVFTLPAQFPPKSPNSNQASSKDRRQRLHRSSLDAKIARRDASLLSFLSLLPPLNRPAPASAFTIGISGPKDWLREQKKKASRFLLAPIDASRNSLRTAYQLLIASDYSYSDKDLEEVQRLFKMAARDCVAEERDSFVTFQASTGVEVCTFRLIVKNAASLLDDKDPVKLEAESMLIDLIRSLTSLDSMLNESDFQVASTRQKVSNVLMDTIFSLDKFEQGIKNCLEI